MQKFFESLQNQVGLSAKVELLKFMSESLNKWLL